jgi:hypothetical protein
VPSVVGTPEEGVGPAAALVLRDGSAVAGLVEEEAPVPTTLVAMEETVSDEEDETGLDTVAEMTPGEELELELRLEQGPD